MSCLFVCLLRQVHLKSAVGHSEILLYMVGNCNSMTISKPTCCLWSLLNYSSIFYSYEAGFEETFYSYYPVVPAVVGTSSSCDRFWGFRWMVLAWRAELFLSYLKMHQSSNRNRNTPTRNHISTYTLKQTNTQTDTNTHKHTQTLPYQPTKC